MKKAGVFDPWRQEPPPEMEIEEAGPAIDAPTDKAPVKDQCVMYRGQHTQLNVWVPGDSEEPQDVAREKILKVVHDVFDLPGGLDYLEDVGITPDGQGFRFSDGVTEIHLSNRFTNPIDTLTYGLRAAERELKGVATLLLKYGVRACIR